MALLGRGQEFARLEAFLERVPSSGGSAVLHGEPGVGKTELWRAGVVAAIERGYGVLQTQPAKAERGLTFSGLADLLAHAGEEIADLPSPQRRPLAVALLLEEPEGAAPDPRAIGVGLLGVLRALAEQHPMVVAVDDLQWLDPASAAALGFALRRGAGERVGALLARRNSEPTQLELDLAIPPDWINVGGLTFDVIQRLLRDRLGPLFTRSTLRRIHDRSGGNPFFALEIAGALRSRGTLPVAGEELLLPDNLMRLVRERLATLPPDTIEPLAAVAALAEPASHAVAEEEALDAAFEAGVLVLTEGRVRFTHPLFAAAAYEALAPRRRRKLHRRLAELVDDSEDRARHIALGADGPDPRIAELLEEAAARAHARGAPEIAADLAELALRLDDGSDADAQARRSAQAAQYYTLCGDDRRASELLECALVVAPSGPPRARLLRGLASAATENVDDVIAMLETAAQEAQGDPRLEAEILAELADAIQDERDVRNSDPYARAAVAAAERLGDPALLAYALCLLAVNEFTLGHGFPFRLMERALELESECDSLTIDKRPLTTFGWMCRCAGDLDRSRMLLAEARGIAEQRGDSRVAEVMFHTCYLELFAEKWKRGLRLADELCDVAVEMERDADLVYGLCARATLLAHLGEEADARDAGRRGLALAERIGAEGPVVLIPWALGLLELSLDRPAAALPLLRRPTESRERHGIKHPDLQFSFSLHAEAAIAVGEFEEAEQLLGWIEETAAQLDRAWALACVARCRGLLAAAKGDEPAAARAFERALRDHERVQHRRFELARTLLAQGETMRRFKRRGTARHAIEAATGIFDQIGAGLWAAKARRELARISGRRSVHGLTETELRVANLVVAGRSNKEVAGELFVTVRTVEANLTKVYAKLGVRSRMELAKRFPE
jgi:DNA-binding CsgD family transcriptional regulator